MRYHYKLINNIDPTNIPYDSRANLEFKGFTGIQLAEESGDLRRRYLGLDPQEYHVKLIPTPETNAEKVEMSDESIHSAMETIE